MKDKITLTLDIDLLERIDKEMVRHQQSNRSKFIAFVLRQVLFNPVERLKILEKQREFFLSKFKVMNDDILKLAEHIELMRQAEEKLKPEEEIKDNVKDALWQT